MSMAHGLGTMSISHWEEAGEKLSRNILNLLVVWLFTGLWHGAGWTFVLWGFMYFVLLMVEKLTDFEHKKFLFKHLYTMLFVVIGWVIFRSKNISKAFCYIGTMFGLGKNVLLDTVFFDLAKQFWILIIIGFILSVFKIKDISDSKAFQIVSGILYIIGFVITSTFIAKGYNPFIYFNF